MIIPKNEYVRDVGSEIDEAIEEILKDDRFKSLGWTNIKVGCHQRLKDGQLVIFKDVAAEVATRFKAAGYYCHYNVTPRGGIESLSVNVHPDPFGRDI